MIEGLTAAAIAASATGTLPASLAEPPRQPFHVVQVPRSAGTDLGYFVDLIDSQTVVSDMVFHQVQPQLGWLETWRDTLASYHRLPTGWDGAGAAAPNGSAVSLALDVLEEFWELGVQPTRIAPTVEEGVLIEFRTGEGAGNVECFNSGEILAALNTGEAPEVWEISEHGRSLRESVSEILATLQG
jgi:hypothetical protein